MTPRQTAILKYHRDIALFAVTKPEEVFIILDLEDREGFAIASELHPDCAMKREAIKAGGAYPAFTLIAPRTDANRLLAHGWPRAKSIPSIPKDRVAMMLISDGRCVIVFIPRT